MCSGKYHSLLLTCCMFLATARQKIFNFAGLLPFCTKRSKPISNKKLATNFHSMELNLFLSLPCTFLKKKHLYKSMYPSPFCLYCTCKRASERSLFYVCAGPTETALLLHGNCYPETQLAKCTGINHILHAQLNS